MNQEGLLEIEEPLEGEISAQKVQPKNKQQKVRVIQFVGDPFADVKSTVTP